MLKRLGFGLLKGLLIGGAIGAGFQYGLHWTDVTEGLLGFLIAMGAAGTAGVFAGKAPWREGAWIEATVKGVIGVALGALGYFGITYIRYEIPFVGVEGDHAIAALPVLFAPAVAGLYGAFVEFDNTSESTASSTEKKSSSRSKKSRAKKTRIDDPFDLDGAPTSKRRAKRAKS